MRIPELGPLLGTLVEPADAGRRDPLLEALRLEMVGSLFERGRAAREHAAQGEDAAARSALGPRVWIELWESTVEQAALRLGNAIERRLREAAAYSRYPEKRLAGQLPSPEDRRILSARLSAAGVGLEAAATQLDAAPEEWPAALRRTAGELEQAWERLERTTASELAFWNARIEAVGEWRRPWWPIILGGTAAVVLSGWIGLMLGGYIPVPAPLRPAAEWLWSLPWL